MLDVVIFHGSEGGQERGCLFGSVLSRLSCRGPGVLVALSAQLGSIRYKCLFPRFPGFPGAFIDGGIAVRAFCEAGGGDLWI